MCGVMIRAVTGHGAGRHQSLSLTRASKTARAAAARVEFLDYVEAHLNDRDDDELCKPFHRLNRERSFSAIPCRYKNLPLVIRVDKPDEIAKHDTVFMAQSRPRQNDRGNIWIVEMDREA